MNNLKNILIGILAAVLVIAVGASVYNAFAAEGVASPAPVADVQYGNGNGDDNGNGNGNGANNGTHNGNGTGIAAIPASDLSAEEAAALLFMREEEKLARDVYNEMYALWGTPVFQNIAASEQNHMDKIGLLLERYNLEDPALGTGQFTDANLQALYDQLIAQGSISLTDAMNVGILIEQTDIADLQARIAQTDNADIQMVFTNLMNASYNHLAAFSGERGQSGKRGQGGHGRPEWAGAGQGQNK